MANMISLLQAVIVGLLALLGIVITQSWTTRREFAKRRIELAEEVLSLFYEVRDAIRDIRSPGSWEGEGSTRTRAEGESDTESRILDNAFVVVERYRKRESVFNNLKSKKYRFMAIFRGGAHEPFEDINKALNKIFIASHMLGRRYWQRQGRVDMSSEEFQRHLEGMQQQETVFWQASDQDSITEIVDGAVQKVEAITDLAAKEYAGPPGWWQRWTDFVKRQSLPTS